MILGKSDKSLKLKDISSDDVIDVPLTIINTNFIYNYCMTAHSRQGSSIDDNITIFDYRFKYVCRNWLWVAITRATDLNNVYFYDYKEDNSLSDTLINSYFERKIAGYIKQDLQAKRTINKDNFVNVEWLNNCINQTCRYCNTDLYIDLDNNDYITSNITANRINNKEAHHLDNIEPCCINCTCSLSNREK